jgi:hypothetical protein
MQHFRRKQEDWCVCIDQARDELEKDIKMAKNYFILDLSTKYLCSIMNLYPTYIYLMKFAWAFCVAFLMMFNATGTALNS